MGFLPAVLRKTLCPGKLLLLQPYSLRRLAVVVFPVVHSDISTTSEKVVGLLAWLKKPAQMTCLVGIKGGGCVRYDLAAKWRLKCSQRERLSRLLRLILCRFLRIGMSFTMVAVLSPEQVEELNTVTTGLVLLSNSLPTLRKTTEATENDSQKEDAKEKSEPVEMWKSILVPGLCLSRNSLRRYHSHLDFVPEMQRNPVVCALELHVLNAHMNPSSFKLRIATTNIRNQLWFSFSGLRELNDTSPDLYNNNSIHKIFSRRMGKFDRTCPVKLPQHSKHVL